MRSSLLQAARITAGVALVATAALAGSAGCSASPDTSLVTQVAAPDYAQFKGVTASGAPLTATQAGVSRVLERRCATLDCHGQIGRPLRLYGQFGLRFVDDAGNIPGATATTETEHQANYQAVIGLQPEVMSLVVGGANPPESLMLLRKPLQLERHKGGAVFVSGDDAYNCITTWLAGQADFDACGRASQ